MEKELTERDRALIDCLKISAARGRQIREQTETEKANGEQPVKTSPIQEETVSEAEIRRRLALAYRIILEAAGNDDPKDKPKEEVYACTSLMSPSRVLHP